MRFEEVFKSSIIAGFALLSQGILSRIVGLEGHSDNNKATLMYVFHRGRETSCDVNLVVLLLPFSHSCCLHIFHVILELLADSQRFLDHGRMPNRAGGTSRQIPHHTELNLSSNARCMSVLKMT